MTVLRNNNNKDYQNSTTTYIKTRTFCEDSYNISDVLKMTDHQTTQHGISLRSQLPQQTDPRDSAISLFGD